MVAEDASGNYMYYGVREFGMAAIMNGVALHGGLIPYGATFLMFMEYARNAVRMSALMKRRVIYVFTHDSIGLGEDGPTHQPVEQLVALRTTPNTDTWRPADTVESAVARKHAVERKDGPSALIFSRQNLPFRMRDNETEAAIARGGYILKNCAGEPELILIATGSEVSLAVQAADKLAERGRKVRVVSMPCTSVFDAGMRPTSNWCCRLKSVRASPSRRPCGLLVQVCRPRRPHHRHDHLRRVGPGRPAVRGVRLHRRQHPRGRRRAAGGLIATMGGWLRSSIPSSPIRVGWRANCRFPPADRREPMARPSLSRRSQRLRPHRPLRAACIL